MTDRPGIQRLIELQQLLLLLQRVERTVRDPNTQQHENDVEHSYHLAMIAWFLAPHFQLDRDKVIRIALAHELVEIYAGDTAVFGPTANLESKEQREHEALDKLVADWPDFTECLDDLQAYKDKSSPESQFVYALDKLTPAILNYLNKGAAWLEHHVTIADFEAEKEKKIPRDSPIWQYYQELLAMLKQHPDYFEP